MNTQHYGNVMLANLRISQWTARKTDKRAAKEVETAHGATDKAQGTYYKSLVSSDTLDQIKQLVNEVRGYHYRMTLPWIDNGPRVLSAQLYFEYSQKMQDYASQFDALTDTFLQQYPVEREEAKRTLGTLFVEADYPHTAELADKFLFRVDVLPLPIGSDFRCQIGNAEVEAALRADIDARATEAMAAAAADVVERVRVVVEAFIDRLASEDTRFKDSLVQNARDLAAILPGLNFAKDPKLDKITADLQAKLCAVEPDDLRKDMTARRAAYDAAVGMKKDLGAFFGF